MRLLRRLNLPHTRRRNGLNLRHSLDAQGIALLFAQRFLLALQQLALVLNFRPLNFRALNFRALNFGLRCDLLLRSHALRLRHCLRNIRFLLTSRLSPASGVRLPSRLGLPIEAAVEAARVLGSDGAPFRS